LQGLGRLSSALVGAYLQRKAGDAQVEREGEYRNQLASALSGLGDNVPSAITAIGSVPGNELAALNAAASYQATVAAREPKTPVQMFNRKTRDVKLVIPGSQEQLRLSNQNYEMGNLPNPESGFMFKDGKQVVRPGGKEARALINEYVKPVKKNEEQFVIADRAYEEAKSFAKDPSGGKDTALIYKFFSTLDPGGRVTDSEAMLAQTSASLGDQLAVKLRQGLQSGVLGKTTRQELVDTMRGLVEQRRNNLQKTMVNITPRLSELGFNPQSIFPYYKQFMQAGSSPTQATSSNQNVIIPGQEILPADGSVADPSITNATDDDLLRSLL